MRPQDAVSPRSRIAEDSVDVIYTAPDGSWSLSELIWDDTPAVGCRWNGDIHNPDDKGNPRSHASGTWFILPIEIGAPLAALARSFRTGFAE